MPGNGVARRRWTPRMDAHWGHTLEADAWDKLVLWTCGRQGKRTERDAHWEQMPWMDLCWRHTQGRDGCIPQTDTKSGYTPETCTGDRHRGRTGAVDKRTPRKEASE